MEDGLEVALRWLIGHGEQGYTVCVDMGFGGEQFLLPFICVDCQERLLPEQNKPLAADRGGPRPNSFEGIEIYSLKSTHS